MILCISRIFFDERSTNCLQGEFGLEDESYEICYNHASYLLGRALYAEACEKLKEAESKRALLSHHGRWGESDSDLIK